MKIQVLTLQEVSHSGDADCIKFIIVQKIIETDKLTLFLLFKCSTLRLVNSDNILTVVY